MSILGKIKKGVESSGSNRGKIIFIKDGGKVRVRFLQDVEDGLEVTIHDSFDRGINAICRTHFGEECPYCDDEDLRHRTAYGWSVFDHDAKEVKVFVGYANNFNPLPALIGMYESYGTLLDRDYVLGRSGKQTNTSYSVVPMDKVKFKNPKAKAYTKAKLLDILSKAYPVNDGDEVQKKNGKKKKSQKEEEDFDDEEEEDENEYESMTPRELYQECVERGLKGVKKKQKAKYYIQLLEEDDEKSNGNDDEDWEEEDEDEDNDW